MKQLDDQYQESSASAQTVASIDDLLLEIFVRLGLKSFVQFKSVSKRWNSLLSDPKLHLLRSRQPNPPVGLICQAELMDKLMNRFCAYVVLFQKPLHRPILLEFPTADNNQPLTRIGIMHSCNGLLLCSGGNYEALTNRYFVLNPTTMKCTRIPETKHKSSTIILAMCLAFVPYESPHYKVLCVSGTGDTWAGMGNRRPWTKCVYTQFEVYSSDTGSWRTTSMQPFSAKLNIRNGVYWNGAFHWIPYDRDCLSFYFNPRDQDQQMPCVFPTPPISQYHWGYTYYFGVASGHLHFVDYAPRAELTVYEMRSDYSEWFVKYKSRYQLKRTLPICAMVRSKEVDDYFILLWDSDMGMTLEYDIVRETFKMLNSTYPCPHVPLLYFESISLV